MSNYKQANVAGTSWVRCSMITINNPLASNTHYPTIHFQEQKIIYISNNDVTVSTVPGNLSTKYNPDSVVQVYDPATLQPVVGQTFTHQQLYQMLFSAYIDIALARDGNNT